MQNWEGRVLDGVVVAGPIADPLGGNEFTADLTGVSHNGRRVWPRAGSRRASVRYPTLEGVVREMSETATHR